MDEQVHKEVNAVWDLSDPSQAAKADPLAVMSLGCLVEVLASAGPLTHGRVGEVESTGIMILNGVKYDVALVFSARLHPETDPFKADGAPVYPTVYRQ
jgi:hypothetical protein